MWNEGLFWTVWKAQPGNFSSHYAAFSKGQPLTLRTGHCCSTPLCEFWLPIPFTINIANISGLLPIYRSWLWIYLFKIYRQYIGTGCTRSAVKILKVSTTSRDSKMTEFSVIQKRHPSGTLTAGGGSLNSKIVLDQEKKQNHLSSTRSVTPAGRWTNF